MLIVNIGCRGLFSVLAASPYPAQCAMLGLILLRAILNQLWGCCPHDLRHDAAGVELQSMGSCLTLLGDTSLLGLQSLFCCNAPPAPCALQVRRCEPVTGPVLIVLAPCGKTHHDVGTSCLVLWVRNKHRGCGLFLQLLLCAAGVPCGLVQQILVRLACAREVHAVLIRAGRQRRALPLQQSGVLRHAAALYETLGFLAGSTL